MRNNHTLEMAFLLLLLCNSVGCGSSTTRSAKDTESDQHAEHLEHHLPEHRPATFAAAVEQISSRNSRIREEMRKITHEPLDREFSELLDILSWLPEIAGDSDLRQADWAIVQRHSDQLTLLYQKLDPAAAGVQIEPVSFDEIEALIEDLKPFVSASVRRY